ncbi:quinol dehydrogenase ferredoxin subunit NapH [Varunaivibrio sulfuroxidans]|uniref:Ferredoxin-type protein NapH n=1 Tax=Varunaivibrio sulfuroxidans TaxID=1773489 RepID=A0A4R3JCR2_9PROT|nr:quinol dehydrogenase ferredoxin subunit NapH [Varunaivibrio sulfuroxidans]TCS62470.1 ferredoxin-type protein NapH [Varunaivibrio sulfuroxidans]WES30855.1 quinol dehydrogenase ferredoxin subunit NapH [Varunaivibrio sulfuroxidans]
MTAIRARGQYDAPPPRRRPWLRRHKWLLLRRASQFGVIALFLAGPMYGVWIVKGSLISSKTMGVLPLSDPYVALQSLAAGHLLASTTLIGAAIVLGFYMLVGGRAYCAFVCPMNIVTDAARWLSKRLQLPKGWTPPAETRFWLLGATLLAAVFAALPAWELINPVTVLSRSLLFGFGYAWTVVFAIFVFDFLISRRGWCGRLCPMGAFYGVLGAGALLRVAAKERERCDDCMDCFAVCPEPQVIAPALRGTQKDASRRILSGVCTNCGRCIDVCEKEVFAFSWRLAAVRPTGPGVFNTREGAREAGYSHVETTEGRKP